MVEPALRALWAQVVACHAADGHAVDYDACMDALAAGGADDEVAAAAGLLVNE